MSDQKKDKSTLYCSFCGKSQHEVRKLIAGPPPSAFICDECVEKCLDIVAEGSPNLRDKKPLPATTISFLEVELTLHGALAQVKIQPGKDSKEVPGFRITGRGTYDVQSTLSSAPHITMTSQGKKGATISLAQEVSGEFSGGCTIEGSGIVEVTCRNAAKKRAPRTKAPAKKQTPAKNAPAKET